LRARFLTAAIGIPAIVLVVWFGYPWLLFAILALALVALQELFHFTEKTGIRPSHVAGTLMLVAVVMAFQFPEIHNKYALVIGSGVVLLSLLSILAGRERRSFNDWTYTIAGVLYVGFLLSHILLLREVGDNDEGRKWVLFGLFATFATDSAAFFTGICLGKHRMAPDISPKKTWEGALGGFAGAVGAGLALGAVMGLPAMLWQQAILGAAVGVAAQFGDLVESQIKRAAGVKDSSGLLPGHGGLLDRLDSVLFAMPVLYYLVVLGLGRS
jgi:phosphatidate cytidylyltransferase